MRIQSAFPMVCLLGLSATLITKAETETMGKAQIHVGIQEGEIRGDNHRVLQAAIDYAASLGGGTVYIGPGHYQMRNALTLCWAESIQTS